MRQDSRFLFIHVNGAEPSKTRNTLVRSHAAKKTGARVERVIQYQKEKRWREAQAREYAEIGHPPHWTSTGRSREGNRMMDPYEANYHPHRALSSIPRRCTTTGDPFDSLARRMTPDDSYLLDKCMRRIPNLLMPDLSAHQRPIAVFEFAITESFETGLARGLAYRSGSPPPWVRVSAMDDGLLAMILAASCHFVHSRTSSPAWARRALHYQGEVISSLRVNLAYDKDAPSDLALTKAMSLCTEAVSICPNFESQVQNKLTQR